MNPTPQDMTSYLTALTGTAAVAGALVTGLQRWTTLSPRVTNLLNLVFGLGAGVLFHYSGFLELAAGEPRNTILSAVWGLVASAAGAGVTNTNLLHILKPPAA